MLILCSSQRQASHTPAENERLRRTKGLKGVRSPATGLRAHGVVLPELHGQDSLIPQIFGGSSDMPIKVLGVEDTQGDKLVSVTDEMLH